MSNRVYITLKEEKELNFDLNVIDETSKRSVYINCDEISAYLGSFETKEELEEIIAPENILQSIEESLSEYESDHILSLLECRDYKYQLGYYPCYGYRVAIEGDKLEEDNEDESYGWCSECGREFIITDETLEDLCADCKEELGE